MVRIVSSGWWYIINLTVSHEQSPGKSLLDKKSHRAEGRQGQDTAVWVSGEAINKPPIYLLLVPNCCSWLSNRRSSHLSLKPSPVKTNTATLEIMCCLWATLACSLLLPSMMVSWQYWGQAYCTFITHHILQLQHTYCQAELPCKVFFRLSQSFLYSQWNVMCPKVILYKLIYYFQMCSPLTVATTGPVSGTQASKRSHRDRTYSAIIRGALVEKWHPDAHICLWLYCLSLGN